MAAKRTWRHGLATWASVVALSAFGYVAAGDVAKGKDEDKNDDKAAAMQTASPIKHVIILIGENRGLDHTFGIYKPKGREQTIANLVAKGIVNADGSPGPNFALARQFSVAPQPAYYIGAPNSAKTLYGMTNPMPEPNTAGAPLVQGTASPPFTQAALATVNEPDIEPADEELLTTGFVDRALTNLGANSVDLRFPVTAQAPIPNGPFAMQGPILDDDDYTGDTTHRFYQAWQQSDCSLANASKNNPSGCLNDLFPFVMDTYARSATRQGNFSEGSSMAFLNAEDGEAVFLRGLADKFTLNDNFHQSFQGGTGANHFMLGTGDAGFWSDGKGNAIPVPATITVPNVTPSGTVPLTVTVAAKIVANPNPTGTAGTNNQYTVDGNFSDCSNPANPGVGPIVSYLENLPYEPASNCASAHFYMLNNTNPGFLPDGTPAPVEAGAATIPPSTVRTIGDALNDKNITWAYYGGAYNAAKALSAVAVALNPQNPNLSQAALADPADALGVAYCQICNPFQYASSIMADPAQRDAHVKDTVDLVEAIETNTLPSVSFGKPDGLLDGHPQTSKVDLFESYARKILAALDAKPKLRRETAVFITWDEAGGYWDSGFIQPLDFFGDGPRIPLLVVSEFSAGGQVNHSYADHVSLVKFIERNWGLKPLTARSRDRFPNPKTRDNNPYLPVNSPALDDLFDAFDFDGHADDKSFSD